MAQEIQRSTLPFDVTIQLPEVVISSQHMLESQLYKDWEDSLYTNNPVSSQVQFFTNLNTVVSQDQISILFYQWWYQFSQNVHPIVLEEVKKLNSFQPLSESLGGLTYYEETYSTTNDNDILPYNKVNQQNINDNDLLKDAEEKTNSLLQETLQNLITDKTSTQSHMSNLVKDTEHSTRIKGILDTLKSILRTQYPNIIKLTGIDTIFTGELQLNNQKFEIDLEGSTIEVDILNKKINPTVGWLTLERLNIN